VARILVCDDQEAVRRLIRIALEGDGHSVLEAGDGPEAIESATRETPDLIIVDLVLPGQSGLDVLDELRRKPALTDVPMLLLTGSRVIGDAETAAWFGASAYLTKPVEMPELQRTVQDLLVA
jgi:CheY-like chemotaxis protein